MLLVPDKWFWWQDEWKNEKSFNVYFMYLPYPLICRKEKRFRIVMFWPWTFSIISIGSTKRRHFFVPRINQ